jgi:hypothetical protein
VVDRTKYAAGFGPREERQRVTEDSRKQPGRRSARFAGPPVTAGTRTLRHPHHAGPPLPSQPPPDTVEPGPGPGVLRLLRLGVRRQRTGSIRPRRWGPYVFWFRILFLVIELMPIAFKVFMSMRGRRPYEVAKAVLEHGVQLAAIDHLDRHLHRVATTTKDRRLADEAALGLARPRRRRDEGVIDAASDGILARVTTPSEKSPAGELLLVAIVEMAPGQAEAGQRYEDAVLGLLERHGGSIERRLRGTDSTTEVHVIRFRARTGYESFMVDPDRLGYRDGLGAAAPNTRVLEVREL